MDGPHAVDDYKPYELEEWIMSLSEYDAMRYYDYAVALLAHKIVKALRP